MNKLETHTEDLIHELLYLWRVKDRECRSWVRQYRNLKCDKSDHTDKWRIILFGVGAALGMLLGFGVAHL